MLYVRNICLNIILRCKEWLFSLPSHFRQNICMHFSSFTCMLYCSSVLSFLVWCPPLYLINYIHDGTLLYSIFSILLILPVCFKLYLQHVLHGIVTPAQSNKTVFFYTLIFILLCKKGEENENSERKDNYSTFMGSKCHIQTNFPSSNKIPAVLWASVMHRKQYDFSVRFFPSRRLLLYIIMDAV